MDDNIVMITNPTIDNVNCFVASLELHELKILFENKKIEEIKEMFLHLLNKKHLINEIADGFKKDKNNFGEVTKIIRNELFVYSVSNGIILAINDSHPLHLDILLYICLYIRLFCFNKYSISIKGGVANDCFFGDAMIAFGKGFINAYSLMKQYNMKQQRIVIEGESLTKLPGYNSDSIAVDDKEHEKEIVYSSSKWKYKVYKDVNEKCFYIDS